MVAGAASATVVAVATTKLIRAKLSEADWQKARQKALRERVPVSEWVGRAIRDALLKGAKP